MTTTPGFFPILLMILGNAEMSKSVKLVLADTEFCNILDCSNRPEEQTSQSL